VLIEVFRELEITGDTAKLTTFLSQFVKALPHGWHRDVAREKEIRRNTSDARHFAFRVAANEARPDVHLYLVRSGPLLRVSNVTPTQLGQISRRQYNSCIEEFWRIASPITERLGLQTSLTSGELNISEMLSPEAMKALRGFSSLANMSSGASHPSDYQRWLNFLVLAHKSGSTLDADKLQRWLIDEERWPETEAHDLGSKFDFARELLSAYDKSGT
jgi:hypothetical protein